MILFLDDWNYFPDAIIHHTTKNESFVRLARLYKKMGVKNWYFHLALQNPALADLDPHSPNLTVDQMLMIGIECKNNPWYFFREVMRFAPIGDDKPRPFIANRGNIALIWLFLNHIDAANVQPRQTGKSATSDAIMLYVLYIAGQSQKINLLTKDDDLRKDNIGRLKEYRDLLPNYLVIRSKDDADNKEELTCNAKKNSYKTAIGQNNKISANNLGRGLTAPVLQIDEGPFINYMQIVFPAIMAAGTRARRLAAKAGGYYGNLFTTTAGKKDTESGAFFYDMFMGGMPWTEHLFDSNGQTALAAIVRANSPGLKSLVNVTLSHRQLGYTDEWLKEVLQEVNSTGEAADRDFFNRWTSGGLTSPLVVEILEMIRGSQQDPAHVEITKDLYALNWYIPIDKIEQVMASKMHVIGLDTSDAIGKDSITMVVMDVDDLSTVMTLACNETNLIRFSGFIADYMIKYKNTVLIPERKSSWTTIVDTLCIRFPVLGIDPFERIYNVIVDRYMEMENEYAIARMGIQRRPKNVYDKFKKYFGYNTAATGAHSREALYSNALQSAARRAADKVKDRRLIDEITGLETRNGRIDHSEHGHDDMVIAWLLCVWFLTLSKNLKFYGIHSALTGAVEFNRRVEIVDPYEQYMIDEQNRQKEEILRLLEELKATENEILALKLEIRIRQLDSMLTDDMLSDTSIDTLIQEAKGAKRKKMYNSRPVENVRKIIEKSQWMY